MKPRFFFYFFVRGGDSFAFVDDGIVLLAGPFSHIKTA